VIRTARLVAYATASAVCFSYALDAPLWVGAAVLGVILVPIGLTVAWDYFRLRGAAGLRGDA
jgi:hypothetical protein